MSNTFISNTPVNINKTIIISFNTNNSSSYSVSFSFETENDVITREVLVKKNLISYKSPLKNEISTSYSNDSTVLSNLGCYLFGENLVINSNDNIQNNYFVGKIMDDCKNFTFYDNSSNDILNFNDINTFHSIENKPFVKEITPQVLTIDDIFETEDIHLITDCSNEDITFLASDYELTVDNTNSYSTIILKENDKIIKSFICPITDKTIRFSISDKCNSILLSQLNCKTNFYENVC